MSDSFNNPPEFSDEAGVLEIPYQSLSAGTLEGIIEEFASRDGTDYGETEYSLSEKVQQVEAQLKAGKLTLLFDPVSESCQLVNSQDWKSS